MENIKYYIEKLKNMKAERGGLDSVWQDLADYVMPRKAEVESVTTEGDPLSTDIFDTTAIDSNNVLAAGLHGYLTNPASRWFSLVIQDKELMKSHDVKLWLHDTEQATFDAINNSNFHEEIHELYLDLGCMGTAHMHIEEDIEDMIRYYSLPVGEVFVSEDDKHRITEIYREFLYTAQQISQRWPESVPELVKGALKNNDFFKKFPILHVIEPRTIYNYRKKDSMNKPYRSLYIFLENRKEDFLSEGGYDVMPIRTVRFLKQTGKIYGYSPAMVVYASIRLLNKMQETTIRAAQKMVDPPISVPYEGFFLPMESGPGAVNFDMQGDGKIQTIETKGNIPLGLEMIQAEQRRIKEAFFVDMFLTLADRRNMTATEVQERVAEKMLMLGPTLGRLMSELLDPLVYRTVDILISKGHIAPPPDSIKGKNYLVDYISPLAKAQKAAEAGSVRNLMMTVSELAQFKPEAIDKIKGDAVVDVYANAYGVDPTVLETNENIKEIRKQRAEQQQAQMALQVQEQQANVNATKAQGRKDDSKAQQS